MQRSYWLCTAAVATIVLACVSWQARAAVISIDFGGEWIKVALVKVNSITQCGLPKNKCQYVSLLIRQEGLSTRECSQRRCGSVCNVFIFYLISTAWCSHGDRIE